MTSHSGPTAKSSKSGFRANMPPPSLDTDPFDPMQAFKWGFELFRSDPVKVALPVIVVETVALFVTLVAPRLACSMIRSAVEVVAPQHGLDVIGMAQHLTETLLGIVSFAYAAACLYPYLLNLARGRAVEATEAFRPGLHLPNALKLAAILLLAEGLGFSLCFLPGVAVVALTATAFPALLDHDLDPLTALRKSFEQARAHPIPFTIFGLLCVAVTLIGAALCIFGAILVSLPLVLLAQVFVYMRMEGEVPVGMDLT